MALGFTSHYTKHEQPFGSLTIGSTESETAGSVAYTDNHPCGLMISVPSYDSCEFSVSVDIDYSQYAGYVGSEGGSTETAGSVASLGISSGSVGTVTSFSCGCSSGGGSGCASYTC